MVKVPGQLNHYSSLDSTNFGDCHCATAACRPSLYDLSLFHVTWPPVPPFNPVFPQVYQRPALGRLSIYFAVQDAVTDSLFSWLSQTHSRTSISHLLLFSHESSALFRISAASLRPGTLDRLTILGSHMVLTTLKVNMASNLTLAVYPSVHTLFLYADAVNPSVKEGGISFWKTLEFMLRDAQFHLRRLYVRNVSAGLLGLQEDRIDSDLVDVILSRDNFKDLQFVQFTVVLSGTTTLSMPVLTRTVQSRLPGLHSRRLIRVVPWR
ncbi:hypothetical protein L226DRAFT_534531 [Lentinus tigrinus ALCF2SS1-7]|uniref:uncharacterized protein n=1 Tax=Lentinus tigrinus ALCF2SS1-7 TaxID=1328758 RepID=UPI001165FCF0|nr:hypothetical protein L226DRAFT_534531 [Lentinus tigrinus ALCF2SS1-7]